MLKDLDKTIPRRSYICTFNNWYDVLSLGFSVHRDTANIYFEEHQATSYGDAKQKFIRNAAELGEFKDVRCRLYTKKSFPHLYS